MATNAPSADLGSRSPLAGEPNPSSDLVGGNSSCFAPPTETLKKRFDSPARGEWARVAWSPLTLLTLLLFFVVTPFAHAASIDKPLADATKEQMARSVFHELRCVVCEGQSLADSNATLALQMRAHVRELIAEGKSEAEVLEFFRKRYGEQILMTPRMGPKTVLLWFAPLLLLALGGVLVWRVTRHGGSA